LAVLLSVTVFLDANDHLNFKVTVSGRDYIGSIEYLEPDIKDYPNGWTQEEFQRYLYSSVSKLYETSGLYRLQVTDHLKNVASASVNLFIKAWGQGEVYMIILERERIIIFLQLGLHIDIPESWWAWQYIN